MSCVPDPRSLVAVLAAAVACALSGGAVHAENGSASSGSPEGRRVVVLKNGRLVDGRVTRNASGCRVERPAGEFFVPSDQVALVAPTRRKAYEKLRDRLPPNSVDAHMRLARWCLKYRMYGACRDEVRIVLKNDRNHQPARDLLKRLDRVLNPGTERSEPPEPPGIAPGRFRASEAVSLGGLSRESARVYVQRIQPLLVNRCGNAACHGRAADSPFRLENVSIGSGGQRALTRRNLDAVLEFVAPDRPGRSPLLTVLEGDHPGAQKAIFGGPNGAAQRRMLRQWVHKVAKETSGIPGDGPDGSAPSGSGKGRSGRDRPTAEPSLQQSPSGSSDRATDRPGDDLLNEVRQDARPDAFDPDLFNRKVHGRSN